MKGVTTHVGAGAAARYAYPAAFAACTAATVAVLWGVKYLPMTDLPQHASQVAMWVHYDDPAYNYRELLELNFFTPYLAGYLLARGFATFLPVLAAMKLVVTLAVLAQPAAMHYLLGKTGGDRWWSLAAFPVALGYTFLWGFFNFMVALPLALLMIAWTFGYAERPTPRGAARLALMACLLFWAHLVLMAFACCAAGLVIACRAWHARAGVGRAVMRLAPLAAPLPLMVLWLAFRGEPSPVEPRETVWDFNPRRLAVPLRLVSNASDPAGAVAGPALALLLATALLARGGGLRPPADRQPEATGRRVRDACAWAPAVVALATYLFMPSTLMGVGFLYQRFAAIVFLLACVPAVAPASPRVRFAVRLGVLAVALAWPALLGYRFAEFNRSAAGFDRLLEHMKPHARVLSRIRARDAISRGDWGFLNFADYYVVEKGGLVVYSPAFVSHALARFRPGAAPPNIPRAFGLLPEEFSWEAQGGYDYYVVRSTDDPTAAVFKADAGRVRRVMREGTWWLYEPLPSPTVAPAGTAPTTTDDRIPQPPTPSESP